MYPTPKVLEEISVGWLCDVLNERVEAVEVCAIAAGEGFMGQLARVTFTVADDEAPRSVIVKLPTADPGGDGADFDVRNVFVEHVAEPTIRNLFEHLRGWIHVEWLYRLTSGERTHIKSASKLSV